eukprot:1684157-Pyramimonas_sp.AAC.1
MPISSPPLPPPANPVACAGAHCYSSSPPPAIHPRRPVLAAAPVICPRPPPLSLKSLQRVLDCAMATPPSRLTPRRPKELRRAQCQETNRELGCRDHGHGAPRKVGPGEFMQLRVGVLRKHSVGGRGEVEEWNSFAEPDSQAA